MGVKYTNKTVLTTSWQTVSNGLANAILSPVGLGKVEFAVADAAADLAADDIGHTINAAKNREPIVLKDLGTKDVMARTDAAGVALAVAVLVTAY